jgi:trimeric autotransporter adhesin
MEVVILFSKNPILMKKPPILRNLLFFTVLLISNYLFAAPGNDAVSAATQLTSGVSPSTVSGNLYSGSAATGTTGISTFCTGTPTSGDVWYYFVARTTFPTIALSGMVNTTGNLGKGNGIQIFNTNSTDPAIISTITVATLNSNSAGCIYSTNGTTNSLTPSSALTIGNVYLIRIYTTQSITTPASKWAFSIKVTDPVVTSGRLNEAFMQTTLSGSGILNYPWEVTYGPDGNLWVTEAQGYKVYRINPSTGAKTTILDISQGASGYLTSGEHTTYNVQFSTSTSTPGFTWPQGGMAGLALHPKFLDPVTPKNYVYISYVHKFDSTSVLGSYYGVFFRNSVVRFTYNTGTGKLESPVTICDTLPGSSDHNSQRMIIVPVSGTYYLFYAQGDMGAGQFGNRDRTEKAQWDNSYEGKILRFNLEPDGDAGTYDQWIPNDNPFNGATQSAVWAKGIRNNQGFAYNSTLDILYGSQHGPFSDDEINIIERGKNYGHPLVIGYSWDNNVNNTKAGAAPGMNPADASTAGCPMITSESGNAAAIGSTYKDPLFSAYPSSTAFPSVTNLWATTNGSNGSWPSEAWSGLDLYTNTVIPDWKGTLVAASLKWGRLVRLRVDASGSAMAHNVTTDIQNDTISYFGSKNRFRDLAFDPNGKDIYVIMDNSSTTSGPGNANPVVPTCAGCLMKYTFLGYPDDGSGKSSIDSSVHITAGTANTCNSATTVTIDASNSNYWVPITGPDGNIMAEINANGQTLGTITSSFYQNSGAIRVRNGVHYLDRNMTITPQTQPSSPVKIRLYISKAEYDALDADPLSGISAITDVKILKNSDPCGSAVQSNTTLITPTVAEAHGYNGYVLQGSISGFSSFYFGGSTITLPLQLITFTGALQADKTTLLKWKTQNERNASSFIVERSTDGTRFAAIGNVAATNNISSAYSYIDADAAYQHSTILFYRLKMTNEDGSFSYSSVVTILLTNVKGDVTVSPNPVISTAKVNISSAQTGTIQWKLYDNAGQVILQNSSNVSAGTGNILTINMDKVAAGSYYLHVSGAGVDQNVKVQKL